MGFLDGVVKGVTAAATGGDGRMNLADVLKMGAMAAAAGTGNVPALLAMGTSFAGDATGSKTLSTIGDVASMATGVGGIANMASGAASAASAAGGAAEAAGGAGMLASNAASPLMDAAATTAGSVAVPYAAGASFLESATPTAFSALGANPVAPTGNVFDAASKASDGGKQFKMALNAVLGSGGPGEKFGNGIDLAQQVNDIYASSSTAPPPPPQLPQIPSEDFSNYIPTGMSLQDLRSQGGAQVSPFSARYSNVYGG
jgi:hypothetical protein